MQPDLFKPGDQLPNGLLSDGPIARSSDPDTSKIAAHQLTKSGERGIQQQRVFGMLCARPGHTAAELARSFDADRYMVSRRLPDLEHRKWVRKGENRPCNVTGKLALTWFPTPHGFEQFRGPEQQAAK